MELKVLEIDKAIVIELYDLDIPRPEIIEWTKDSQYNLENWNSNIGDRITGKYANEQQVQNYFTNLINENVYPAIIDNKIFQDEFGSPPLTFMQNNSNFGASLLKDQVGWIQPPHNDSRTYIMAGVFYLEDTLNNGTDLYGDINNTEPIYKTTSKKNTAALWVNTVHSKHSIGPVTHERLFYLLNVRWKLDFSQHAGLF